MTTITITITTDGAAFSDPDGNPDPGREVARILQGVAGRFGDSSGPLVADTHPIRDYNGARCGSFTIAD